MSRCHKGPAVLNMTCQLEFVLSVEHSSSTHHDSVDVSRPNAIATRRTDLLGGYALAKIIKQSRPAQYREYLNLLARTVLTIINLRTARHATNSNHSPLQRPWRPQLRAYSLCWNQGIAGLLRSLYRESDIWSHNASIMTGLRKSTIIQRRGSGSRVYVRPQGRRA
jgi:hypothetical protein